MTRRLEAGQIWKEFRSDPASPHSPAVQKAVFLARRLQERALELQTAAERRQQAELDRLLRNPSDKATLSQITDQAFRARDAHRAVDHLIHILDVQGIPRFFRPLDRTLLKGFQSFGEYAPGVALPLVKEHMRKETANVILPAEREILARHLRARAEEGLRMNVNFLGEAIVGEAEAERRLQQYLLALQWPEVEVVSIKISTLYSQISPLAHEHTVAILCDRLERLFRTAARMLFTRVDGTQAPKFVYLDMEEYRDLALTAEAFQHTLSRPGLENVAAGIALQAYIPDSFRALLDLLDWARGRVAGGGAPVTLRLVKGANLEMERVEASLKGWPQATYKVKAETDANFRRMLHAVMRPENLAACRVGIASHNLFELAYGWVLAEERKALDRVQFEMLEGMANAQRRAVVELQSNMLLYAPACRKEHFLHAIGYLIRRLDENTGPENFLRHAFRLEVGSPEWNRLEQGFLDAFAQVERVSDKPRRTQDRLRAPPASTPAISGGWTRFVNEADTDFALPANQRWAIEIIEKWRTRCNEHAARIPIVVAGTDRFDGGPVSECLDPSRPGVVVGRYRRATESDVEAAVDCAARDPEGWRTLAVRERFARLGKVTREIRIARGDLMGAALANAGKTLAESDPEVSEAIDFVEFYRDTARCFQELPGLEARGRGVVVVVAPWNFPIAIPGGGMAAALAAGNTVILKPASDAVLVAYELCQCFWRAGIPKTTLQFLPCAGGAEARRLVSHPRADAVILTGSTATALTMLRERPDLQLAAETGGKNATIVTALSDRDQALKHIVHSAFSHSGQKCSATSLLLLEAEVYDDPDFRRSLCDAVRSLPVGSAWDLTTKMGPLIRPPRDDLEQALKVLEPGEEWAVMPRASEVNPNLWSPGVKYGVTRGSKTHLTEFFGPVLGVIRFEKLIDAIDCVNATGYGLTSGLESLDAREWDFWKERIRAGNLYINRVTTGAIVLRQPFGGMGKSAFGPGIKAGGPNYVAQFIEFRDTGAPNPAVPIAHEDTARLCKSLRERIQRSREITLEEVDRIWTAASSYAHQCRAEFGQEHDHFRLLGQDNIRRYLPVVDVRIRLHPEDSAFDLFARVCAARTVGCRITVSLPGNMRSAAVPLLEELTEPWAAGIEFVEETDEQLAQVILDQQTDRLRYAAPERVPPTIRAAAARTGFTIVSRRVLREGRIELLWYLQEQSLSIDYHRYGNLGARVDEPRAEPL